MVAGDSCLPSRVEHPSASPACWTTLVEGRSIQVQRLPYCTFADVSKYLSIFENVLLLIHKLGHRHLYYFQTLFGVIPCIIVLELEPLELCWCVVKYKTGSYVGTPVRFFGIGKHAMMAR